MNTELRVGMDRMVPHYDGIEETSTHLACQPICSNCSDIAFWCQIPMPYAGGVSIMSDFERIKVAGSGGTCPC